LRERWRESENERPGAGEGGISATRLGCPRAHRITHIHQGLLRKTFYKNKKYEENTKKQQQQIKTKQLLEALFHQLSSLSKSTFLLWRRRHQNFPLAGVGPAQGQPQRCQLE
jgi:hypothetical protein